ncbi:MAG TPA: hypothetical protein VF069_22515 [Streptosporangiaceae bacterium]
MKESTNPVLRRLDALVGEWQVDVLGEDGVPVARSRSVFAWDGMLLVHHAEAEPPLPNTPPEWITHAPFPITAVIGLDDLSGQFSMMYTDARDVHRVYAMSMEGGVWKFWGQAGPEFHQRATGTFTPDGNVIHALIERSADGHHWETDFASTYTKVK